MHKGYRELSFLIRKSILEMIYSAGASHIGSCFSLVDILVVLYAGILRINSDKPDDYGRDRIILSKGHAAAAMYAVLAEKGFFSKEWLRSYCKDGSKLGGHITHHGIPGVEVSTGSLGHGLPIGCGMALSAKRDLDSYRVFVLLSDGECNEGSVWEAALFAAQHHLDNLIAIIDYNKIQSFGRTKEVLDLEPFLDKWRSFRWAVKEIDGHNHNQIQECLESVPFRDSMPSVIVAHTIKGKGVSFMENQLSWHYKSPDAVQFAQALKELEENK